MPDPESIRSLEARWERQPTESFWTAFTGFVYDSEFVGYVPIRDDQEVIADVVTWGLEWEVAYTTECDRFSASQAYTTLASFDLIDPTIQQGFSSMPYGFGHELANWSPLSTKLQWQHTPQRVHALLSLPRSSTGAFREAKVTPSYNQATAPSNPDPTQQLPYAEPGYTKAFGPAFFVDYGFEYKLTDWSTVNLNFYNVLGWFDEAAQQTELHPRRAKRKLSLRRRLNRRGVQCANVVQRDASGLGQLHPKLATENQTVSALLAVLPSRAERHSVPVVARRVTDRLKTTAYGCTPPRRVIQMPTIESDGSPKR